MSASSPSSSVLLTVEDKGPVTRSSQYTAIAPRNASATTSAASAAAENSSAAPGLAAIAPATESRSEGTPISPNSPERPAKRKKAPDSHPPGSEEWQKVRRESHKEVERRRREVINKGIDKLADLIPGAEKNKGRIIAQAVDYIHRLKTTESANIEKWTIEKLLADQAISELTSQVEQLKAENKKLRFRLKDVQPDGLLAEDGNGEMAPVEVHRQLAEGHGAQEEIVHGEGDHADDSMDMNALQEAAQAAATSISLSQESKAAKKKTG